MTAQIHQQTESTAPGVQDTDGTIMSADQYIKDGAARVYGTANPSVMEKPFWKFIVRTLHTPWTIRQAFGDEIVWSKKYGGGVEDEDSGGESDSEGEGLDREGPLGDEETFGAEKDQEGKGKSNGGNFSDNDELPKIPNPPLDEEDTFEDPNEGPRPEGGWNLHTSFGASTPGWTFNRLGQSITTLPDGRTIYIGGEHEDSYDPDFHVYNDVIVRDPFAHSDGGEGITIYGYPRDVFPPTDFHTATLVEEVDSGGEVTGERWIYVIGGVGYVGDVHQGNTRVYRLDLENFSMHAVDTTGTPDRGLNHHKAELLGGNVIEIVTSTSRANIRKGDLEVHKVFHLDLSNMRWTEREDLKGEREPWSGEYDFGSGDSFASQPEDFEANSVQDEDEDGDEREVTSGRFELMRIEN
jgi:hypothetical protein